MNTIVEIYLHNLNEEVLTEIEFLSLFKNGDLQEKIKSSVDKFLHSVKGIKDTDHIIKKMKSLPIPHLDIDKVKNILNKNDKFKNLQKKAEKVLTNSLSKETTPELITLASFLVTFKSIYANSEHEKNVTPVSKLNTELHKIVYKVNNLIDSRDYEQTETGNSTPSDKKINSENISDLVLGTVLISLGISLTVGIMWFGWQVLIPIAAFFANWPIITVILVIIVTLAIAQIRANVGELRKNR